MAAIPMPLDWLDVGSWPLFAANCPRDERATPWRPSGTCSWNPPAPGGLRRSGHLIAAIGCEDLDHRPHARRHADLPADRAEEIKKVYGMVGERYGNGVLVRSLRRDLTG